jgi:ribulose 1,5-bisphosphate carboxylase large subunit-like protein
LHDDLLHDKNTYHAEEQNSRLTIIRKLIKLLGWKHINDSKVMKKTEFDENVISALGKSEAFTDQKTKVIFNMSKSKLDVKGDFNTLRYINELLKGFSIKIDAFYDGGRKDENKRYRLSEINNVSEIVYYLINRGKLHLQDDHHFVEPEYKRFHDLYKPNTKIESNVNTALLDVDIWAEDE